MATTLAAAKELIGGLLVGVAFVLVVAQFNHLIRLNPARQPPELGCAFFYAIAVCFSALSLSNVVAMNNQDVHNQIEQMKMFILQVRGTSRANRGRQTASRRRHQPTEKGSKADSNGISEGHVLTRCCCPTVSLCVGGPREG